MTDPFKFQLRTRLVFGAGSLEQLGHVARELRFKKPLLVADQGLRDAGHADRAVRLLRTSGLDPIPFHDFDVNPDTTMVERGRVFAEPHDVDAIIGLGGGSSMDCAKSINFLLTNGGSMADYCGYGKASKPMLPMIAVPTTAGTGSEAQSYAVIADAESHLKMACGDPKLAFRLALLDPELTLSQPAPVTGAAGFDAIAHAVETAVTTRRTPVSQIFSHEAYRLLSTNFERVLQSPYDLDARGAMHLGSFYAGMAIEQSMLGAAHACANPLTARYSITHGAALAVLLPHVVRWNASADHNLYEEFVASTMTGTKGPSGDRLADSLVQIGIVGGLPNRLRDTGVKKEDLATLAKLAGEQWTAAFNPIPFGSSDALEVYRCAY